MNVLTSNLLFIETVYAQRVQLKMNKYQMLWKEFQGKVYKSNYNWYKHFINRICNQTKSDTPFYWLFYPNFLQYISKSSKLNVFLVQYTDILHYILDLIKNWLLLKGQIELLLAGHRMTNNTRLQCKYKSSQNASNWLKRWNLFLKNAFFCWN